MKYTAITLGPIIKTLGLAHKTRELWAASYFFSDLMEKIIEKLNLNDMIIIPYPDKQNIINNIQYKEKIKSAGIFPDRLLLKDSLLDQLQEATKYAILELADKYGFKCGMDQLTRYLNTYIIEFEYYSDDTNHSNVIYKANDLLAIAELNAKYESRDSECFINMFEQLPQTDFYKSLFNKNLYGSSGFPSILEISTQGLDTEAVELNDDEIEDDNKLWEKIKEKNPKFKILHKYIAIVQADGDNVGKIIGEIANQGIDEMKLFSKALSAFSIKAAEIIADYQGIPIYTGGDDLLFFAPVSNEQQNIFELITKLDELFKIEITDNFNSYTYIPSMSYGLSITYYKFPMHEALNNVRNLLFDIAKATKNKNALAVNIQKHSRQTYTTVITKPFTNKFESLIKKDEGLVINSVLHNLEEQKVLLGEALLSSSNANLDEFFDHFYNEDIHNKSRDFINDIKELLKEVYNKNNQDYEKTLAQVKAQLQIIKFLNDTKDE